MKLLKEAVRQRFELKASDQALPVTVVVPARFADISSSLDRFEKA